MGALNISNLNNNSHHSGFYDNKLDNNTSFSTVGKMESADILTPPEPYEVIDPIEIDNPFQNPFDWDSVKNPFEMIPPEEFNQEQELEAPSTSQSVMAPYTYEDGGASKAAQFGKKVSVDELEQKYKCSTCESRKHKNNVFDTEALLKKSRQASKARHKKMDAIEDNQREFQERAEDARKTQRVTRDHAKKARENQQIAVEVARATRENQQVDVAEAKALRESQKVSSEQIEFDRVASEFTKPSVSFEPASNTPARVGGDFKDFGTSSENSDMSKDNMKQQLKELSFSFEI